MGDAYMNYAMSTISGRALPDSRDGLKPVHRRILMTMNDLNMRSNKPFIKSAKVVGATLGSYHPHGDNSVYDALVRMAQGFSMRETLIEGQGNFGSIDGDKAASQRYSECRLNKYGEHMLLDLDADTVEMVNNYDSSKLEPTVLPTRMPNLLVNGTEGIAVGMASKIPPHNLGEVIDGVIAVIANPNITIEELLGNYIAGPDFPTGGIIINRGDLVSLYKSGKGRAVIRSKVHRETINNRDALVVTEIPYNINKSKLVEQIAELTKSNDVLNGIHTIRDESDKHGIRVVIEVKRNVDINILESALFKYSNLQVTFTANMLAISNMTPKVMDLKEMINDFVNHRVNVIIRKTMYTLKRLEERRHLLEGYIKALNDIKRVIDVIMKSADPKEAKQRVKEMLDLSDIQVTAIVEMQLQRLTSMEKSKIESELNTILKDMKRLNKLLNNDAIIYSNITDELLEVKKLFATPRRTEITDIATDLDDMSLIPNISMVLTLSGKGYMKRTPTLVYDQQNRGGKGKIALKTHSDDFVKDFFVANNHDTLMFITNLGRTYTTHVYKVPESSSNSIGLPVGNLINLQKNEIVTNIIPVKEFTKESSVVFFTKRGMVNRINLEKFKSVRSNGVNTISLKSDDSVVCVKLATPKDKLITILTMNGQLIKFSLADITESNRNTVGSIGIRLNEDDVVIDGELFKSDKEEIMTISVGGLGKRTKLSEYRKTNRGGKGVTAMGLSNRAGKTVVGAMSVDKGYDLMIMTVAGKLIRIDMSDVNNTGRTASGTILVKGDKVKAISKAAKEESVLDDVK